MSERDRGAATLAARRPAEAARHARRDAGFVDEHELSRIEIKLSFEPGFARSLDVFAFLLARMARLLLARDPVPRQETPHSSIAEGETVALPELVAQLHDRRVRLRLDLPEDERRVCLDALRSAIAAHLHGRNVARGLDALRPANGGRRTDIKARRRLTPRHPALDRLHDLLANIL